MLLRSRLEGIGMDVKSWDAYLRLSDGRVEEAFEGREARIRAEAARRGITIRRVVVENDLNPDGTIKPASAFKRKKIPLPTGAVEYRTVRPVFRQEIIDLSLGIIGGLFFEDLDRACRDPRDLEDLIDACHNSKGSAASLSGSLTLTRGGTDNEITMARNMVNYKNMESRDKSRRAAEGRERWAGKSYQGGRRPFGYQVVRDTEQYHRNLVIDQDEATAIQAAVTDILDYDISLKAIARQWRETGISTVCGNPWSGETVKDTLCKPAIAGLAVYKGDLRPAPWDEIIDRDTWEKLTEKLNDPARTFTTSNEPRWLLSKWATCGICGALAVCTGGGMDKKTGKLRPRAYSCSAAGHLRRNAAVCDEYISGLIVARLSQPDIGELLRPPARSGIDTATLKAEAGRLTRAKAKLARLLAEDEIDEEDAKRETRRIRARLTEIAAQLAASDAPDPLADFRERPAQAVWDSLSLARRREVAKLLVEVRFVRATRRGPVFDPDSLQVEWLVEQAG
jgi:DNA invertase Pin-like site-specific DNA recombinase